MIDWSTISVQMFAKCPTGRPKTRLQPPLTPIEATKLHMQLATRTLRVLHSTCGAPVLWLDQSSDHPWLAYLRNELHCSIQTQCTGDLGVRMQHALGTGLSSKAAVILTGSDCAVLQTGHLQQLAQLLTNGCEAALIPAEDGGYAAIGLCCHDSALFTGIDWGTSAVLRQTRERLRRLGWRWGETELLWDVDVPADLKRLQRRGIRLPVLPDW